MAQKLYSWESTFNFEIYEKNIIEDDIIPDKDIENLKNFIKSYCNANYNGYKATGNSGYSVETVDGSGPSDCNGCDTTANCFKASTSCSDHDGDSCPNNCPGNCPGKYVSSCANPNTAPGGAELAP